MFGMGWPELAVCALVGFFVFGPERLPGVARDAARALAKLRTMAQGVTDELKEQLPERESLGLAELRELGDLRELHPRRIVRSALFDNDRDKPVKAAAAVATRSADPSISAAVNATAVPVARTLRSSAHADTPTFVPVYDVDAT
jgi:sec-independent protein translocase protein TatB